LVNRWIQLAKWLQDRGIRTFADCDQEVLHQYGLFVRDTAASRQMAAKTLAAVTRLWAYDELSARPTGLARPPWDETGVDDYLPAANSLGDEHERSRLTHQEIPA
jgi:hypothetical protein